MKFQHFLMKHGIGSPGYIAKTMTRQYRLIKESKPEFDELAVLHYVYANRVAAQSAFGGPEIYKMSRKNPDLIHQAISENPHLFLIIKHAVLIEHPELQNPRAPSDRFEALDRIIAEVIEQETRGWARVLPMAQHGVGSLGEVAETNEESFQPPILPRAVRPQSGDSVEHALVVFRQACKDEAGTLFITEEWVLPRMESLSAFLNDPITDDQAEALCDAIEKRVKLDDVIGWLSDSVLPWSIFLERKQECEHQLRMLYEEKKRIEQKEMYWEQRLTRWTRAETDWEAQMIDEACQARHDVSKAAEKYGERAHPCPRCGSTELRWFYYATPIPPPDSPASRLSPIPWCAGWATACKHCRVKVDFFVERRT